jgi:3-hydroxy-9,10-secoandrosta-1,3,5(10)-triene-9,17-dione monooxygenase reductase component
MGAPTSDEFRQAMGLLPTGVTVVTAPSGEGPLGATANAVSSLSLEPPLMLASLDVGSRTLGAIRAEGRFGVSVLGAGQESVARAFATKAPSAEKWADVPADEHEGVPLIAEAPLWIACDLREAHAEGDHVILIGAVTGLGGSGGEPLVFHRGSYRAL